MADIQFLTKNVVTVDDARVLKPTGKAWEAKGWTYVYAPVAGEAQVFIKLADGTQIEAARAMITLDKNQCGFIAVRTQVTIKDKSEMPVPQAKEI